MRERERERDQNKRFHFENVSYIRESNNSIFFSFPLNAYRGISFNTFDKDLPWHPQA